jgi:hypothetical protein
VATTALLGHPGGRRLTIPNVPRITLSPRKVVLGLAGSLVGSVLYDVIPNRWFETEFEDLRLPSWFRPLFVVVKGSAVLGLLLGFRSSQLGRFTARALVAYFVLAIGAHVRVKDRPVRYAAAMAMLVWSAQATQSFPNAVPSPSA